jgi:hypothetical protein
MKFTTNYYICILHVEVPDGSYILVPVDEDEGAGGDVFVLTKASPGSLTRVFFNL